MKNNCLSRRGHGMRMKEENKYMDELISTYLVEGLKADSLEELKKWIAASPKNEKYFMERQEVWASGLSGKEDTVYNREKAFEQFKNRVAKAQQNVEVAAPRKQFGLSVFWRYAAAVAILFVVSFFSYWRGGEKVKENFSEIVVEAPLGSKIKLSLPDGTQVWLNAGSRMAYSQGFGVEDRQVNLSGEGYFEVKRNEKLPFLVQTKELKLQVLGTKFNFRNYPEDSEVIVSLLEGKVALDNLIKRENKLYLSPNERMVMNKANGKMQLERAQASNASQWTSGYLFFDEELLPDIAKELERSYNVKIHIADDTLNTFRFYGNFVRREQNIHEVLDNLSATGKLSYKIKGSEVTLYVASGN